MKQLVNVLLAIDKAHTAQLRQVMWIRLIWVKPGDGPNRPTSRGGGYI